MPELAKLFLLLHHLYRRLYPAIVIYISINGLHFNFISLLSESLCVFIGLNGFVVSNHPYFISVPGSAISYIIVCPIKMQVPEQKTFYSLILQMHFTTCSDGCMVLLVHHFITLYIKSPVKFSGYQLQGFIR